MASSLLALLDDIATALDDIAVMTKVATKKTAGVLGDDLALNANQVTGVRADRELPVVWAVAKGSLFNKTILIPAALAISVFVPWLVMPLMMLGGAYLCFEGAEKLAHRLLHSKAEDAAHHAEITEALVDPDIDMVALERDKIRGAIRTDFILSAEIIVITLGTVADASLTVKIAVLIGIGLLMTVGVYGLVAGIVKLDDAGLYLTGRQTTGRGFRFRLGRVLLGTAPILMKLLSVAGTAAMFLVGGGILVHGLPWLHHQIVHLVGETGWFASVGGVVAEGLAGLLVGIVIVLVVAAIKRLRPQPVAAH